ncbi:MAG: 8-amino-7-oxononanoate synthase [Gammaproteobacteria bacterium]|nr:8-amino-7-oxononanoate synthase [Gammaproteobacteria bacterium]
MGRSFADIPAQLDKLAQRSMYRRRKVIESRQGRELIIDGRRLLNFCSNDYLGLAGDKRVAEAFKAGADRWGVGSGASHLVCGHTSAHHELEEALAAFTGRPRALFFSSGYAANLGVINALVGSRDRVYEDRLNHASLLDGGWISRAQFGWYEHCDATDLQQQLQAGASDDCRQLVVSDGVFSMDGDICPLEDLSAVTSGHNAWLMIDDAHGFGVLGNRGQGLVDPARFGVNDVPVLMATLGKALGTSGAFVAGDEDLIEFLIQRARNYIYTTALPAAVAVATLKSLEIVAEEDWRRSHLEQLIQRFRSGAEQQGLNLLPSETAIQPVIIGEAAQTVAVSQALETRGFLITAIRPPTVPQGTARLRITLTAAHTEADIDMLLQVLAEVLDDVAATGTDD